MTDLNRTALNTVADVLLRCWILGTVFLLIWFGATLLIGKWIYDLHGSMFGLSRHEIDLVFYCGMGLLKLVVVTGFFIPWLAIKMVLKRGAI
jgi:hypothetical protein